MIDRRGGSYACNNEVAAAPLCTAGMAVEVIPRFDMLFVVRWVRGEGDFMRNSQLTLTLRQ